MRALSLSWPAEKLSKTFSHPLEVTTIMVVHEHRTVLAVHAQVHVVRVSEIVYREAERARRDLEVVAAAVGGLEGADVPRASRVQATSRAKPPRPPVARLASAVGDRRIGRAQRG
jgi:ABC-type transporter Mla maintaining outer membrane lipid asymmetry ATPase subunit MlaF